MVSGILNRNSNATAKFPAFDWPVSNGPAFLPKEFRTIILFGALGAMVLVGLVYATVESGIDLTIGAVPIEMPMRVQVPPAGK